MPSSPTENVDTNEKQPGPPRTAFVCFKDSNSVILFEKNPGAKKKEIHSLVAEAWRKLSSKERAHWEEVSRQDKTRFLQEKQNFKGVWVEPQRRKKKNPKAPKRTMSAFLKYSQSRRASVQTQNPHLENTDISRLLGEMWRNASEEEKSPYIEAELVERAEYKEKMRVFNEQERLKDATSRQSHENITNPKGLLREPYHYYPKPFQNPPPGSFAHRPFPPHQHSGFYPSMHYHHPPPPPPPLDSFRPHHSREYNKRVDEGNVLSNDAVFHPWQEEDMPIPPPPEDEEGSDPDQFFADLNMDGRIDAPSVGGYFQPHRAYPVDHGREAHYFSTFDHLPEDPTSFPPTKRRLIRKY